MRQFQAPRQSLGDLDPDAAAVLIAAASDIALIVDRHGVICDYAVGKPELSDGLAGQGSWIGRPWTETVTVESRGKIEALLRDAIEVGGGRSRQVNHPAAQQDSVPVLYSAVPFGREGRVAAFGRDLQEMSMLQRRLVDAQQSLERDYSQLRHVETRYRLLFKVAPEPVFIADAETLKVLEANPAAVDRFGEGASAPGQALEQLFDPATFSRVQSLLAVVRSGGRGDAVRAGLRAGQGEAVVSAFIFRQQGGSLFLLRLSPVLSEADAVALPKVAQKMLKLVESAPDGFVVTDAAGRIVAANPAFLELCQLVSDRQVHNEPLDRWLGSPGVDLNVLLSNLRQRGTVRLFATILRSEYGVATDVEVSATSVMNSERECFGFAIRNIARRLRPDPRSPELPRSVAHLTELVGRVSLKELVREATDVIERLSIQAALTMTGDNRASAADMLGLSRQSLYVKLRRYGLADGLPDGEGEEP